MQVQTLPDDSFQIIQNKRPVRAPVVELLEEDEDEPKDNDERVERLLSKLD